MEDGVPLPATSILRYFGLKGPTQTLMDSFVNVSTPKETITAYGTAIGKRDPTLAASQPKILTASMSCLSRKEPSARR